MRKVNNKLYAISFFFIDGFYSLLIYVQD